MQISTKYKKQRNKVEDIKAKNPGRISAPEWKDFYQNQNLFYKNQQTRTRQVKGRDRNILNEETQIMERWKQYFEELLFTDEIIGTENSERNEQLIKSEIHTDDLVDAIRTLKKGKAAGNWRNAEK